MLSRLTWLSLAPDTRQNLAILLGIPRSSGTEVIDNRVASDGYTDSDLATLTLEKLQQFMRSDSTNFYDLFKELVERLELPPMDLSSATLKTPIQTPGSLQKRFCEQCDSKGVRHKKECPNSSKNKV